MRICHFYLFLSIVSSVAGGCQVAALRQACDSAPPAKGPATLLEWQPGKKADDKKENGDRKNGDDGAKEAKANGNGSGNEDTQPEDPWADAIKTDRPDFTEASTTVGKGRAQLETGVTYSLNRKNGGTNQLFTYPEALLRVGMFAEWLEFRAGWLFNSQHDDTGTVPVVLHGGNDLYLGVKLALTEQQSYFPESALVLQMTVPTGHSSFSSQHVMPGINYLFGWDVIEDRLDFGGSVQANRALDESGHFYVEVAQSLTAGLHFTKRLGAYCEWFAFYPAGAVAPETTAQHYLNGGFTFKFTPNLQGDIRAGLGLSQRADDVFAGVGLAARR